MDQVMRALAPAVIASIALQQVIELADPVLDRFVRAHKKWILSALSLALALILTLAFGFRLLGPLNHAAPPWLDVLVTCLFLVGGTKAFNDLLKWIGYSKEARKASLSQDQIRQV
jgi:protein-S-isoprenylcysteine O-methyltransferase Ste14